ncbi:MAG TPA: hypothetical protein VNI01_12430, partial [Elusimicrobiota bacterium]|nr:hypothetical protein [Elusimicrobiota bacterium]
MAQRLKALAEAERSQAVEFIRYLMEFDRRRAFLDLGYSSTFNYCTQALGFSAAMAFRRIRAARLAWRWPQVLNMLEQGVIHLEALALLSSYLDEENGEYLLEQAQGKTVRDVELMVAALYPRPDVPDSMRVLSAPNSLAAPQDSGGLFLCGKSQPMGSEGAQSGSTAGGGGDSNACEPDPSSASEAPMPASGKTADSQTNARVHFSFSGSRRLYDAVQRARELLRHKYPMG